MSEGAKPSEAANARIVNRRLLIFPPPVFVQTGCPLGQSYFPATCVAPLRRYCAARREVLMLKSPVGQRTIVRAWQYRGPTLEIGRHGLRSRSSQILIPP